MALLRFKEAYADRETTFGNKNNRVDIDDYSVYANRDDKVGSVKDMLFESMSGNIRYLIVDTGFWFFGKNVLLPIGLARFDDKNKRVYVDGLTKDQVENLPEYHDDTTVDRDYEARVRNGYRSLGENRSRQFMGKDYKVDEYRAYPGSAALHGVTEQPAGNAKAANRDRQTAAETFDYDREPGLYGMDKDAHHPIRLYQERLIADKERFKVGTVSVGKHVETETQEVAVPVTNERVVIERKNPGSTKPVTGNPDFHEGEVARVETYGETVDIDKEAFVREEVNVRKEVERDTVTARETVRREELDVDAEGNPTINDRR